MKNTFVSMIRGFRRRKASKARKTRSHLIESLEQRQLMTAQLLADWRFDESSASSVMDSSGNQKSLALTGMVSGDWVPPPTTLLDNTHGLHFGSTAKLG